MVIGRERVEPKANALAAEAEPALGVGLGLLVGGHPRSVTRKKIQHESC